MTKVSVIVPYRDAEKYILKTIESLLAQTYSQVEMVFVDNGSSDDSHLMVDSMVSQLESGVKNLFFRPKGKSLALNYAIHHATGDWIAICDADDVWHATKLEKQMSKAAEGVDIIGTQMRYIDASENIKPGAPVLPITNSEIYHSILYRKENPVCNSSVVYKKAIHTDIVGFYDPLCAVEDYDLWSRCVFAGLKFANLDEALVDHRIHEASNFNSSKKQALHKDFVDAKNNALNQIRTFLECGN